MSRIEPRPATIKALFAKSGNRCSFPGCSAPLVNERNQFIAQVCHIEAAELAGPRYNSNSTDEERRSYENLILLCYPHHIETNDARLYPTQRLRNIKAEHEASFGEFLYEVDEDVSHKIAIEMAEYWQRVEEKHWREHIARDLAVPIDVFASYSTLSQSALALVQRLGEFVEIVESTDRDLIASVPELFERWQAKTNSHEEFDKELWRLAGRNFETVSLGMRNALIELHTRVVQMELLFLENRLKLLPGDTAAQGRLAFLKSYFIEIATHTGLVD